MTRIAFLTASCMLRDHPDARKDYWEYELEIAALQPACAAIGLSLEPVIWDAADFDPSVFDAVVIGTCWDYMEKPEAFVWADAANADTIKAAFDTLGADDVVVKPVLGAGAWRQARLRRDDALPTADKLPPSDCMIQPFLPAVAEEGEYAFLFFNRDFSHCARKIPAKGDYRVQSEYGGHEEVHTPSADELALARSVLDCIEGDVLYARVDMLRGLDGKLALIEIELIEPYLYPEQGPQIGEVFARGLKALV